MMQMNWMRLRQRFDLPLVMMGLVALALSACEMTSPSRVSTAPIDVRHERYSETMPVASVTREMTAMIADHYGRYGQGPVEVSVTHTAGKSAVRAENDANRIAGWLRAGGVTEVRAGALPLDDAAQAGQVMINYTQVTARPPAGCPPHPAESRDGLAASEDGMFPDYRFGCGVDSYIAQQVVRPKDLLGNAALDRASGERAATRLGDYRAGKDFKDLSGTNASEE